jgi:hypothetical protein
VYESLSSSESAMVLLSQVSVAITMSGFVVSSRLIQLSRLWSRVGV